MNPKVRVKFIQLNTTWVPDTLIDAELGQVLLHDSMSYIYLH